MPGILTEIGKEWRDSENEGRATASKLPAE